MAKHNETGAKGEELAAAYLLEQGYTILDRNWRYKRIEVDIIAEREGVCSFVEVKTRRGSGYGWPEEAVAGPKKKAMLEAANEYILQHPEHYTIRFDIIALVLEDEEIAELVHWEDAFC